MAGRHHQRDRRGLIVPGLLMLVGVVVLALALAPLPTHGSANPAPPALQALSDEDLAHSQPSKPQQALRTPAPPGSSEASPVSPGPSSVPEPSATPQPPQRLPAPADALPVTRLQPVTGSAGKSATRTSDTSTQFQIAIVAESPDLAAAARDAASLVRTDRVTAIVTRLAAVQRPDVLLLLDSAPQGASVWFCSPSSNASQQLATALLVTLGSLPAEPEGADVSSALPCDTLYSGRARMAAALVRLPAGASGLDPARDIAGAVSRYIAENAGSILSSRSVPRLVWPAYGPITSHYGPSHPLGIDIGQSTGDIVAATDGVVEFAGGDPCCSYGYHVIIDGPGGITTLYAHFSEVYVKQGQQVKANQPLGRVGCTGHCTGNHLHFETLVNGVRVDPMTLLP